MHRSFFAALAATAVVGCGPSSNEAQPLRKSPRSQPAALVSRTLPAGSPQPLLASGSAELADASLPVCAELMPDDIHRAPFTYRTGVMGIGHVCGPATTDGDGTIAVYVNPANEGGYALLTPRGSPLPAGKDDCGINGQIFPQPHGFLGTFGVSSVSHVFACRSNGEARILQNEFGLGYLWADDPTGGAVEFTGRIADEENGVVIPRGVVSFAANGEVRWARNVSQVVAVALGVDVNGNTLFLYRAPGYSEPGKLIGLWFDRDGHLVHRFAALSSSDAPDLGDGRLSSSDYFRLVPMIGGGLLLQASDQMSSGSYGELPEHTAWIRAFASLEPTSTPPPPWLAGRMDTDLRIVRGGRGYALLPLPQIVSPCQQAVELLTPDGHRCGTVTFALQDGLCKTERIDIGFDGTVIQQYAHAMEQCGPNGEDCTCGWQFWPAYFR